MPESGEFIPIPWPCNTTVIGCMKWLLESVAIDLNLFWDSQVLRMFLLLCMLIVIMYVGLLLTTFPATSLYV